MYGRKKELGKEDFNEIYRLYAKKPWLIDKEDSLIELFSFCGTKKNKELIIDLLNEFHYVDTQLLGYYLNLIADFILHDTGFLEDTTQISAITFDEEADSSQRILDNIKNPLFSKGWSSVKTVNRFGFIPKHHKRGRTQIVLIDEFIGSGQTILGRIKQLKNDIPKDFELKFCFVAGMEYAINKVEDLGYEVFCPLRLKKGISERYFDDDLSLATEIMYDLESKLQPHINGHDLTTYSFGYSASESLYSMSTGNNTPNSVFPIFWWPRILGDIQRKTLFNRFQRGLR